MTARCADCSERERFSPPTAADVSEPARTVPRQRNKIKHQIHTNHIPPPPSDSLIHLLIELTLRLSASIGLCFITRDVFSGSDVLQPPWKTSSPRACIAVNGRGSARNPYLFQECEPHLPCVYLHLYAADCESTRSSMSQCHHQSSSSSSHTWLIMRSECLLS